MNKIGVIYEITGNPYFDVSSKKASFSEYVMPTEIDCICNTLEHIGYETVLIDGARDIINRKNILNQCCLFFNKSIGFSGLERKLLVPALAGMEHLPLIGSSGYAMTLARHKYHTNRILAGMGFNVPFAFYFSKLEAFHEPPRYPVIIKPNDESDALGISERSVCSNFPELCQQAQFLFHNFTCGVIVEEFIPGEEWKVAVIGNGENAKSYGCVNTLKGGKSMENTLQTRDDVVAASLSYRQPLKKTIVEKALHQAKLIHQKLGLGDYSRCDFRLGIHDDLYCMEVSTHPYLSDHNSSFVCAAKQKLNNIENIFQKIVDSAMKRNGIY